MPDAAACAARLHAVKTGDAAGCFRTALPRSSTVPVLPPAPEWLLAHQIAPAQAQL
jgi:hypothetical protein